MTITYIQGAQLPDLEITWRDSADEVIDFSSGWTFKARVGRQGDPALFEKTSGFTGAATAPNLIISWAETGELGDLAPTKACVAAIAATRTADGKQRKMLVQLDITETVAAVSP